MISCWKCWSIKTTAYALTAVLLLCGAYLFLPTSEARFLPSAGDIKCLIADDPRCREIYPFTQDELNLGQVILDKNKGKFPGFPQETCDNFIHGFLLDALLKRNGQPMKDLFLPVMTEKSHDYLYCEYDINGYYVRIKDCNYVYIYLEHLDPKSDFIPPQPADYPGLCKKISRKYFRFEIQISNYGLLPETDNRIYQASFSHGDTVEDGKFYTNGHWLFIIAPKALAYPNVFYDIGVNEWMEYREQKHITDKELYGKVRTYIRKFSDLNIFISPLWHINPRRWQKRTPISPHNDK